MSSLQLVKDEVAVLPAEQIIAVTSEKKFVPITVDHYPGGEPLIKDVVGDIAALIVRPQNMESLLAALFFLDVSEDRGYPPIDLILPYFPGARQDRINEEGDLLFTARSVARLINNTNNINYVKILDPHSDVVPALLDRCMVYGADFALGHEITFFSTLPSYTGIIAPDAGSEKRAQKVARLMEIPVYQGWKNRDVKSGTLTGFGVLLDHPGHYLVVDDICDGGGTFLGLAKNFFNYGVTADLYVTHGIFSGNMTALRHAYQQIYCTDSIIHVLEPATVIRAVERML